MEKVLLTGLTKHQQFHFVIFVGGPFLPACRVKGNQSVSRHIPYTNTVCRYDKFVS